MTDKYELEKWLWTENDFEMMGWHDSRVDAVAFSPENLEIAFDIDYIFQWVHPPQDEIFFSFWVSSATLVFENTYDVKFDISSYEGGLEIDCIKRESISSPKNTKYIEKDKEWIWTIDCQERDIKFLSAGYKQYIRSEPKLGGQTLELETRGISFYRGINA